MKKRTVASRRSSASTVKTGGSFKSRKAVSKPQTASGRRPKPIETIAFVSLGCPKNLVDSEKMLGLLAQDGLIPVADHAQADAIIINTCGFLEASKTESIEEIQQAATYKKAGSCQRLIVAGCLVQRHRAQMLQWCPEIDALIGVFDRDHIVEAVRPPMSAARRASAKGGHPLPVYSSIAASATIAKRERHISSPGYFESDAARLRLTPRHYAYLRISEGCNQNCSFCTIPSIRGKMRSKPVAAILDEATELLNDGAFELNLIGQDTTSYGHDIDYAGANQGLVGLLSELNRHVSRVHRDELPWLRLMYAYPSCFTDEMIGALADLPAVLKYIDMPLQHIADPILTAMKRNTSRKLIETLLEKLHRRIPGLALRTTFISGFPGESKAHHRELVSFIQNAMPGGFEAIGVFPYSPEPHTPAGTLHQDGHAVATEIIQARVEEIMLTQQEIVFKRNEQAVKNKTVCKVLIDAATATATGSSSNTAHSSATVTALAKSADDSLEAPSRRPAQGRLYAGRTYRQAPQIDSVTYVLSKESLSPGQVVSCQITDFDHYDLIAQPVEDLQNTVSLPIMVR